MRTDRPSSAVDAPRLALREDPRSRPASGLWALRRGELIDSVTRDVLDYFESCPRCGYPAQSSETLRRFSKGFTERNLFRTCGLPCGWFDSSTSVTDSVPDQWR
jgi:hypothetical protein